MVVDRCNDLPYGKDFLDAVNDMLLDDGVASKSIKKNCEACGEPRTTRAALADFSGDSVRRMERIKAIDGTDKYNKMCSTCAKAKV